MASIAAPPPGTPDISTPGDGGRTGTLSAMQRVLMVRHGETDWNAANRWQGWIDIALNEVGLQQAHSKAKELRNADHIFAAVASSDLSRAHQTAEVLQAELGITTHFVHPGFRERFGGDWQGLTRHEIGSGWPEQVELWRSGKLAGPPNAETIDTMLDRFDTALTACTSAVPLGDILLVTHGGIQRAIANRAGVAMDGVLENLGSMWFEINGAGILQVHSSQTVTTQRGMIAE